MTKKELVEALAGLPDDLPIFVSEEDAGIGTYYEAGTVEFRPEQGDEPSGIIISA